jgi:hypothetical protein
MTTVKTIVSFDVGMRNLAFAAIRVDDERRVGLLRWELIDLADYESSEDNQTVVPAIIRALDDADVLGTDGVDLVLIENQPCMKNPKMKTVQVAIHAFFETLRHYLGAGGGVRLVNPSNKVGHGGKYADRKRAAIARCREFLERELVDGGEGLMSRSAALEVFGKAKKKDDLADALLQALWYVGSTMTPKRLRPPPDVLAAQGAAARSASFT